MPVARIRDLKPGLPWRAGPRQRPEGRAGWRQRPEWRAAVAAVELAVVLPLLVLILVIVADFARLFFHVTTITNCARNGALYESDPFSPLRNSYTDYKKATVADGQSLNPPLAEDKINKASGTDDEGPYVEVSVEYQFQLVTGYLGFGTVDLKRTVRMRLAPSIPDSP